MRPNAHQRDGETTPAGAAARGWLESRRPHQNGTSDEKGLPDKIDAASPLWWSPLHGRSPVIANGRVYTWLRARGLSCRRCCSAANRAPASLGAAVQRLPREHGLQPLQHRRGGGCGTGVYLCTTPGECPARQQQGAVAALLDGGDRPADVSEQPVHTVDRRRPGHPPPCEQQLSRKIRRDPFYAYDKAARSVWSTRPGVQAQPTRSRRGLRVVAGRAVFYSGTGDGNIVCIVHTGQAL